MFIQASIATRGQIRSGFGYCAQNRQPNPNLGFAGFQIRTRSDFDRFQRSVSDRITTVFYGFTKHKWKKGRSKKHQRDHQHKNIIVNNSRTSTTTKPHIEITQEQINNKPKIYWGGATTTRHRISPPISPLDLAIDISAGSRYWHLNIIGLAARISAGS